MAAAPLRIPTVLWEGNVIPGRSRPRGGAAGHDDRRLVRRDVPRARRPLLPHRDADPRHPRDRPRRRPRTLRPRRRPTGCSSSSAARRPCGGSMRRSSEALPRLVERVHVVHVTGDAGYPGALADRERLPAGLRERYRPYPFLRDDMLAALAAADLVVGRAGSSTLAEVTALGLPMVVVPYPHAAGHQRANARVLVEAGGALLVADEDVRRRRRCSPPPPILDDPERHARMAAASRSLGRPGCRRRRRGAGRSPPRSGGRRPTRRGSSGISRGAGVTVAARRRAAPFDALALGGDIQRRLGVKTSRDEPLARFTTMRVGGPADLFAVAHNAFELRGLVKFARSRGLPARGPRAGQQRRHQRRRRAGPGHPEPRRGRRRSPTSGWSRSPGCRWRAPRPTRSGPACRASSSGSRSRARSAARCGPTRAPTTPTSRPCSSRPSSSARTARRRGSRPRDLGLAYRHSRFKEAGGRRTPAGDRRLGATFRLDAGVGRGRSRRASTRSSAGARRISRSGSRAPARSSAIRPTARPPARSSTRRASRGLRVGGASVSPKHANFLVNDGRGTAADVRRLGDRVRDEVERQFGVRLVHEVVFLGDWAGWDEADATRRRRDWRDPRDASAIADYPPIVVLFGGPSAEHDVSIVSGTAIAGRRCVGRGLDVQPVLIDLDGALVVAAARPRARRPRARRATTTRRARRRRSVARRPGASTASRRPTRSPSSSSRSTARSARTASSRRSSKRSTSPTRAQASPRRRWAWTRPCSSGSSAGSGLPVVDWREIHAGRWASDRAGVLAELEAFATRQRRAAADGQARATRLVGRHDDRTRRRRSVRPPSRRRSASTPWPSSERYLPEAARARGVGHRQRRAAIEQFGPGEVISGREFYDYVAKYTPGHVGDVDARGARARPARARPEATRATPTGPSAPRASPGSTSCCRATALYVSELNTIPGFTPISLFPTLPADGGYDFAGDLPADRRPRAGAARRPRRAPADASRTCRDDPGPYCAAAARGPARSGLPVRGRGSGARPAILSPVRAGAVFVLVLAALAVYGVGASAAFVYRPLDVRAGDRRPTRGATSVSRALGLDGRAPNLFLIRTDRSQAAAPAAAGGARRAR